MATQYDLEEELSGIDVPDVYSVERQMMAFESLTSFFATKSWYCGGPIPQKLLMTEENIERILLTKFNKITFDFIYECLGRLPKDPTYSDITVKWETHILLGLFAEMRKLWVPIDFQPGMAVLYFHLCKGMEIIPTSDCTLVDDDE